LGTSASICLLGVPKMLPNDIAGDIPIDRTIGIKVKISTYFRNFGLVPKLMHHMVIIKLFIYDRMIYHKLNQFEYAMFKAATATIPPTIIRIIL